MDNFTGLGGKFNIYDTDFSPFKDFSQVWIDHSKLFVIILWNIQQCFQERLCDVNVFLFSKDLLVSLRSTSVRKFILTPRKRGFRLKAKSSSGEINLSFFICTSINKDLTFTRKLYPYMGVHMQGACTKTSKNEKIASFLRRL